MAWPWTEEFARAVQSNSTDLDAVQAREQAARKIVDVLTEAATVETPTLEQNDGEDQRWSSRVREEAFKCMINSVYSRPEFVSETLIAKGFVTRLIETLFYGFTHGDQAGIVIADRATLLLDLIKLITVLVNDMQWTAEQEKLLSDVFNTVHQLGGLLLEILRFKHSEISPLNSNLLELKNKAMEVFMFLPGNLLAAFIQQQHSTKEEETGISDGSDGSLIPVIDHLHAMLPLKEMLPTLIVCHNLAKTGDPDMLSCFKKAILPATKTGDLVPVAPPTAIDRTKAFFFKQLKFFLTCLDTDVRRYTSEWLFLLCDENAKDYTHHTGVGNAIGLLRMKGLA
ncbi:Signaling protein RIC-8/synembryn (regulates neurotransmitter secretion) [Phytophthora cinnamomi]|uniref:Signaling protein RIC-8/synembryn (regulates neurotransmitter secretion) n=1 Tax=Phytophthora cinnamomi TaxID=4785 RepID=UPI003559A51A|nr:Signaling protein RIC-8/synembryn (regulates neurotransmitter secretion) [Phytophthora cinnamomi]